MFCTVTKSVCCVPGDSWSVHWHWQSLPAVICLTGHLSLSITHQWAFLHYLILITLTNLISSQGYRGFSIAFSLQTELAVLHLELNRLDDLDLSGWVMPERTLSYLHLRATDAQLWTLWTIPLILYSWYHLGSILSTDLCTGESSPTGKLTEM